MYFLDRALEYREQIGSLEASFVHEGLRLVDEEAIAQLEDKPVTACIGGSLFRYWHLPASGSVHFVNQGIVEEKTAATLQRMEATVLAIAADSVLINAGFCRGRSRSLTSKPPWWTILVSQLSLNFFLCKTSSP